MKPNVVMAAITGLILGVIAELFFAFVDRLPVVSCLLTPVAWLFGLGVPILVGALAAAWGRRGPAGLLDGAVAALLAELASRLVGFCVSLFAAQSFFFGPSYLMPAVGPSVRTLYAGVWEIGWFVVSLAIAALLGALGAFLYNARRG